MKIKIEPYMIFGAVNAVLIACIALIFYFGSEHASKSNYAIRSLSNEILRTKNEYRQNLQDTQRINHAVERWDTIDIKYKNFKEIGHTKIKTFLDTVQEQFIINGGIDYSLSSLKNVTKSFISSQQDPKFNIIVSSTQGSITMEALSDVEILRALLKIINDFPNYITVNSITINKMKDLESNDIRKIRQGTNISFIKININFDWYGLSVMDQRK